MTNNGKKNIVTIWGWTWSYILLSWLKRFCHDNINAIIGMTDEWWSTWLLRDQYWILPPWDIRQAMIAMSNENQELLRKLFYFRFSGWDFHWHNFWNLFLTALEQVTWDFEKAIKKMSQLLDTCWDVIPSTFDKPRLVAQMQSWKEIIWEENIDKIKNSSNIKKIYFDKKAGLNPKIKKVLEEADIIIVWPGSLYTSLITNLIVWDIKNYLKKSKAKKILISNIMNNPSDSKNYTAEDFLNKIEEYIEKDFFDNIVLPINNLTKEQILRYQKEEKYFMSYDLNNFKNKKIEPIIADIIDNKEIKTAKNDIVSNRSLLRYNSDKLAKLIIAKLIWEI